MANDQHDSRPGAPLDWDQAARAMAERGWQPAAATGSARPETAMLTALANVLQPPRPVPPTAAEVEAALHAVHARRDDARQATSPRTATPFSRPARWAAAAAVLVAAGALTWTRAERSRGDGVAKGVPGAGFASAAATGSGVVRSLRLADGSLVVLGPSSALDTAVGFAAGRRELRLRGAAMLDVTHDAAHPFVVRTARGDVRDVGTSFVVRTDAPGGLVVAVRSGAVSLRGTGTADAPQRLAAGDRATLPDRGPVQVEHGAGVDADLAFTRARLELQAAPAATVIETMRRWYGIELRLDDQALLSRRITASFSGESGLDAARIVAAAMGGSVRIVGDTVHVTVAATPAP